MCRIVFFVFFSIFVASLKGSPVQDTIHSSQNIGSKGCFLTIGPSGGWFSVRDLETSPLIYRGFLLGIQLGGLFYGKKAVTLIDYNFSYGKLTSRNYPLYDGNMAVAYNSYLNIGYARRINVTNASEIYIGAKLDLLVNIRDNRKFNNANFNYEGFAMFGPMMIWEKELALKPRKVSLSSSIKPSRERTIKLSASLSVPVISAVERPPFPGIGDFVDGVSPTFNLHQMKIVSFKSLVNIAFTLGISYYLQNGNRLKLSYLWYYYNYYPSTNKVSGVAGTFSFTFLFRLNKK